MRIFVFASNEAGIHGAGSALEAARKWGAQRGVGVGPTGHAYAIPTKDERFRRLSLERIRVYVERFIRYAQGHPELKFTVAAIGCGLAGYKPVQIAPMFMNAPKNCKLPDEFVDVLRKIRCASML